MKTVTNEISNTRQIDLKVFLPLLVLKGSKRMFNAMNNVSIPLVPAAHLDKVTF